MSKSPKQLSVEQFMNSVGRVNFTSETGYSTQLVTRAVKTGKMPARWFPKVRAFCEARGIKPPEHLFKWDDPSLTGNKDKHFANQDQSVSGLATFQVGKT